MLGGAGEDSVALASRSDLRGDPLDNSKTERNEVVETIEIKNVGPVTRLNFQVDEPGLYEILGHNGAGKSKSLEAVSAVVEGGGKLVANDEVGEGRVSAFDVDLRVGRRTTRSGELTARTIGGESLTVFVDPGMRDVERADLERAKALCVLGRIPVDLPAIAETLGIELEGLRAIATERALKHETVPEVAAAIKRDVEEDAREVEDAAKKAESDAAAIRKTVPEFDPAAERDEAKLARWSEEAVRALATAEAEEKAARNARAAGDAARKRLDELGPAPDEADLKADLATANASVAAAESLLQPHRIAEEPRVVAAMDKSLVASKDVEARNTALAEARRAVEAAESRLAVAIEMESKAFEILAAAKREVGAEMSGALSEAQARRSAAEDALEAGRRAIADREAAREAVERASATADPDGIAARVAQLRSSVEAARKAVQNGAVLRSYAAKLAEAETIDSMIAEKKAEAKRLRELASACEEVVTRAIAKVAPRGMRFRRGRLVLPTERGPETPFAELSKGERTKVGIDVVVDALGEGPEGTRPVLVIPQELNEGLDPEARAAVREHLRSRKAIGISARATLGDLRVEESR